MTATSAAQKGKDDHRKHVNLQSIQILRFIAATSVIYAHTANGAFGNFGVDIFFVISGFVMAYVVANGTTPARFAINRISRIVPLYWLLTTLLFALILVRPSLVDASTIEAATWINYIKSLFFIPYYGATGCNLRPMLCAGWTLNYEMFFYACVCLSLILAKKHFLPLSCVLLIAIFAMARFSDNKLMYYFYGATIIFDFILGLLAYVVYRSGLLKTIPGWLLILCSIFAYGIMVYAEIELRHDHFPILAVSSFLLVVSFLGLEKKFNSNAVATAFLAKLGDASYATYLTHWFVLVVMRKIVDEKLSWIQYDSLTGTIIAIIGALAVGQITYNLLDKPLHAHTKKMLNNALLKVHR